MATAPVRTRKDVYKLSATDKTLEWYAKAVAEMQKLPITDPRSWRYQAAIHGYLRSMDPYAKQGEPMPTQQEQAKFWNQCQHSSWFFLSWHRGYLLWFERICLGHIVRLGGPSDWALPYWNYSRAPATVRMLPPAFRPQSVGGKPNPLFVAGRTGGTSGNVGLDPVEVSVDCLKRANFVGTSSGGSPGFGGPQTGFNHGGGPVGACERTPHGDVHVAVGGLMGAFETAGLDPIFWLHHCNIDRLWEVWRKRSGSTGDPTSTNWKNLAFSIHDQNGAVITFKSADMVSTTANGYKYDDISDPFAVSGASVLASVERPGMTEGEAKPAKAAELAGATDEGVPLGQERSSTRVAIAGQARSVLASAAKKRVFLNIENITGDAPSGNYSVYVNVPEGAEPAEHPDHFAGTIPLFGLNVASSEEASHGGSGLTHVLEITDLVRRLQREGTWNEADVDVDFVPLRPVPEGAGVRIGRVSVYHA